MRFLETDIFLYVITAHPEFGPKARKILERIELGDTTLTSSLVMAKSAHGLSITKWSQT